MAKLQVTIKSKPPLSALAGDVKKVVVKVGRTPAGAKGEKGDKGDAFTYADFTPEQLAVFKGDKGDKGNPFTYADFMPEQLAALKGDKGDKGDAVPITTTLGQSETQAVSQKLLTDVLGDIDAALSAINGV